MSGELERITGGTGTMRTPKVMLHFLLSLLCAACPPSVRSAERDGAAAAFLESLSLDPAPSQALVICHGFGCAFRDQLVLTSARLAYLRTALAPARSAAEERKRLGGVVAWLDREGGRAAGTVGRVARASATTKSGPTQMDCVDLTANITELVFLLERNGLLRFHHVAGPVSRGILIDGRTPHTTPVIVETATGTQWSLDSWTRAYGEAPDIMTISDWRAQN